MNAEGNTEGAYYVQSPSRDSDDGGKTVNSSPLTPILCAAASPGRLSRASSSTRFSGYFKPRSPDITIGYHRMTVGNQIHAVEKKTSLDGEGQRWCCFPGFGVGFALLFAFFVLGLWGVSRNQKPEVIMKSIVFENFAVHAGTDASGVGTEMVALNSTVALLFKNTGTFFRVHVSPSPLDLSFSNLVLATGSINEFYQTRKTERTVSVTVEGSEVPLYGGGADLGSRQVQPVPLTLTLRMRARGLVLGRLIRPIFNTVIQCKVDMDSRNMNVALPLVAQCTYN